MSDLGEYFEMGSGGGDQASIMPTYNPIAPGPMQGFGRTQYSMQRGSSGLGILGALGSPAIGAAKLAGLGQAQPAPNGARTAAMAGTGFIIALALLGTAGFLSYQAGKAMAPTPADESKWGWWGIPAGLFLGPWGLGIMGVIANQK